MIYQSSRPPLSSKKSGCLTILGLGNPGSDYENTYHSVGNALINLLAKKIETAPFKMSPAKKIEYSKKPGLILIKSRVFMNESGEILDEIRKISKLEPRCLIVAHDDSDIEIGKFKLAFGRSSAGHHGVESIIRRLKTKAFWRLRIGIRPKTEKSSFAPRKKASQLVLRKIGSEGEKLLQLAFTGAIEKIIEKVKP